MFFFINNTPIFFFSEYRNYSIIQFCDFIYVVIPRFCYHEKLTIAGNCRMCLVELNSGIKPVIACATNLSANVEIVLDSLLIKKARENVLEFILINHPLDCPICDQGGECDLQDQVLMYGSDRSRFKEMKRSVADKEMGPIVKTIMTRCIHCTRCVRFSEEVLGIRSLGVIGRGTNTEIKMNNLFFLNSELSGNIVDICPVGALTLKPFAFTARPWELKSIESIDLLDSLHSNIRVDVKGNRILRILPRINQQINENWISDFIRFSYESLQCFRIKYPYLSINDKHFIGSSFNLFIRLDWEQCFEFIKLFFCFNKINSLTLFAATGIGLFNINFFYFISKVFKNIDFFIENMSFSNIDFRSNYYSSSISDLVNYESFIFYNLNIKENFSVYNARLQSYVLNSYYKKNIIHIGKFVEYAYANKQIGNSFISLFSLLRGKNFINNSFFNMLKNSICLNLNIGNALLSDYMHKLGIFSNIKVNNFSFFSNIHGYFEYGINNMLSINSRSTLSYYYKTTKVDATDNFIYHGTYLPLLEHMNNKQNCLFLPSTNMFECEDSYINLFGDIQNSTEILNTTNTEEIYSDFYIIKNTFFYFFYLFNVQHKNDLLVSFDFIFNELVYFYLNYYILFFDSIKYINNFNYFILKNNSFFYFNISNNNNLEIKNSFFVNYSITLRSFYRLRNMGNTNSFF